MFRTVWHDSVNILYEFIVYVSRITKVANGPTLKLVYEVDMHIIFLFLFFFFFWGGGLSYELTVSFYK